MKLSILSSLISILLLICLASSAAGKPTAPITLSLPEVSWALEVAAPGFVVEEREIAPEGDAARLQAVNQATGVILSAFLEKAPVKGDARKCRDHYWARAMQSPFKKGQISRYEYGEAAIVEHTVPEHLGVTVNQRNVNVYLAEGDYWIDVHLSKFDYRAQDKTLLQAVIQRIGINRSPVRTSSEHFNFGNFFYAQREYGKAAAQYEKALELEKRASTLDGTIWKVLVDQLGMCYGIGGRLAQSRDLYTWAISREPDYPMFYYNLACTHAEMGNLEEALRNLRLAYKHKGNMLPGETLPDPKLDSSFTKYMNAPRFQAELKTMM